MGTPIRGGWVRPAIRGGRHRMSPGHPEWEQPVPGLRTQSTEPWNPWISMESIDFHGPWPRARGPWPGAQGPGPGAQGPRSIVFIKTTYCARIPIEGARFPPFGFAIAEISSNSNEDVSFCRKDLLCPNYDRGCSVSPLRVRYSGDKL